MGLKPYEILTGDCIASMRTLDAEIVQTCVTSPPYFGLRDYGETGQIGLEQTPEEYVAKMVKVFREVRRVLRKDGTVWLNLGDSYATSGKGGNPEESPHRMQSSNVRSLIKGARSPYAGYKQKDIMGIPWRVAFALQQDGWYLRQDIIWHKPNPMPESVRDRCTKSHEYIFLLAKSKSYYFDAEAIAEPVAASTRARLDQDVESQIGSDRVPGKTNGRMKAVKPRFGGNKYGDSDDPKHQTKSGNDYDIAENGLRNKRSVWTVTTKPFKGAHFATFPPDLIEPCILAGSKPGDIVLDPFGGAGTTALVTLRHSRKAVLCELNPEYVKLAEERIAKESWLY